MSEQERNDHEEYVLSPTETYVSSTVTFSDGRLKVTDVKGASAHPNWDGGSHVGRKKTVNFGPQTKKLLTCILTHPSGHYSGDCIFALRGCCALIFLHAL